MVGKVVCIDGFSREIGDRENKFIAVDVGEVFGCFFSGDLPDYISPPAEYKSRSLPDNDIRIPRA